MSLVLLPLILALSISAWYLLHWEVFFNSDFAMIGLIAERIQKTGEPFLYVPKVGYQGLLVEGYLSAFLFKWFGMTPRVLHSTAVLMWLIFVGVFYQSVKVWTDKRIASLASCLLCFASPLFFANVLRTQPNYPETFALGCFLFWAYKKFLDTGKDRYFWGGCFAGGFGFYLYGQIIYFFLAILIVNAYSLVQDAPGEPLWKNKKLDVTLLLGLTLSLLPSIKISGLRLPGPSLGVLCFLIWLGAFFKKHYSKLVAGMVQKKKTCFLGIILFLIGYSPNLYHRWVLGRFAKSGIKLVKFSEEIWANLKIVVFHLDDFLVGSPTKPLSVVLTLVALGVFLWVALKDLKSTQKKVYNPFWVLGALVFLGFFSSRSVTEPFSLRYLLSFHLVLSVALSVVLVQLWSSQRKVALILLGFWMSVGFYSNYSAPERFRRVPKYPQLTRWEDIQPVISFLEEEKLLVGYGDYWLAYLAQFVTQGKVVLEPLYANYLPFFEEAIRQHSRIALVTEKNAKWDYPEVSVYPDKFAINEIFYHRVSEQDFKEWKVWVLERK